MKIYTPEIECTKDYDSFKQFESNRQVSKKHLQTLIQDPTFSEKFFTSPIIVDSNLYIIDGLHRFFAAKKLNIPIFYIIDPTATEDDINIRNTQKRQWERVNYIRFFAEKNPSYHLIKDLMEKHSINANFILAVIEGLMPDGHKAQMEELFKKGQMNCIEKESEIREIMKSLVPAIKMMKTVKRKGAQYLFMDSYIIAFAEIFIEDPKEYHKILDKIAECSLPCKRTAKKEEAKRFLKDVAKWRFSVQNIF